MFFAFIVSLFSADYIPCSDPPLVENSRRRYYEREDGAFVELQCKNGFIFESGEEIRQIKCLENTGKWSEQPGHCKGVKLHCSLFLNIVTARHTCYVLITAFVLVFWNVSAKSCPQLRSVSHGWVDVSKENINVAILFCDAGYQLQDGTTVRAGQCNDGHFPNSCTLTNSV